MSWQYSGAVGYKGYAAIGDGSTSGSNFARLLATGGQISLNQDPLSSQGVWGAGYGNAAQIAWAYNYLRLEGNVSYDLTIPNGGSNAATEFQVWSAVYRFAYGDRTSGKFIKILPDGVNGYKGVGYCSQVSFNASEGAIVTGDLSFQGDAGNSNAGQGIISGQTIEQVAIQGDYLALRGDTHLVPYWATGIYDSDNPDAYKDIISWSCNYSSDIQPLKLCRRQNKPPLGADYLVLGDMTGDGSFTVFTISGDFAPASYQGKKKLNILISPYTNRTGANDTSPAQQVTEGYWLKIPTALVQSGSTSMQTGATYIQADFNFTAYGDGTGAPVQMSEDIE